MMITMIIMITILVIRIIMIKQAAQHKLLSAIEAGRARFDEGTVAASASRVALPSPPLHPSLLVL